VNNRHRETLSRLYHKKRSNADVVRLFQIVLSIAEETGLDAALGCLEQCVTEKRLSWLEANLGALARTSNPLADGYKLFYETYLGISAPHDGQIVETTDTKLVTRWWNDCPTLEACEVLGLDTREICSRVYHTPVQAFLSRVDPRLRFDRNYGALRPYTPYCEEIILLDSDKVRGAAKWPA
jgi:hypothetical protein